jgi:hypothetical protein
VNAALQAHITCLPIEYVQMPELYYACYTATTSKSSSLVIRLIAYVHCMYPVQLTRTLCVYVQFGATVRHVCTGIVCLKFLDPFPVLLSTDGNGHITMWSTCSSSSCKQQLRHLRLHRLHQWQNRQPVSSEHLDYGS